VPVALAAQEVHVALGLAAGLSNRQVAEQLEITASTVRSIAQIAREKIAAGAEVPRGCRGPECLRPVTGERQLYCCPQCRYRSRKAKMGKVVVPLAEHPRREDPVAEKPGRQYPPTRRQLEVAHLLYIQGFTFERTARVLGLHRGNIANHVHRLRKKLGLLGVQPVAMRNELERLGFCVDIYSALDDRVLSTHTKTYLAAFDLLGSLPEGHDQAPAARALMGLTRQRAQLPRHLHPEFDPSGRPLEPVLKHLDLA